MDPMGNSTTPWKINMEPENDGLEYDFPFQIGWFLGSSRSSPGVYYGNEMGVSKKNGIPKSSIKK